MTSSSYSRIRIFVVLISLCLALLGLGCATDARDIDNPRFPSPPAADEFEFVSANPNATSRTGGDVGYGGGVQDTGSVDMSASADVGAGPGNPDRPATVERGDIFRLMGDGLLANLNVYRGLQILDLSDPDVPRIIGQLPIDGSPTELLLVGDHAFVVSNVSARGGSEWDPRPARGSGTLVTAVDLTTPEAPAVLGESLVTGTFLTARVVTGGGREALYVVASDGYDDTTPTRPGSGAGVDLGFEDVGWEGGGWYSASVHSFVLADGGLETVSSVELGGSVQAVQATPEKLMVASASSEWEGGSAVQLFDISDPSGAVLPRGAVEVAGRVTNLFAMDIYNDVLRVVSTDWSTNTVETFDVSDPDRIELLDGVTFGDNEDLYATLFLGNKAFFVTFRRVDPFHAFEITDDGTIYERNEFVISGWNDWFVPTFDGDRLIGVGRDQGGDVDWQDVLALSLYDTTDLANPEPLVTRVHIGNNDTYSEANFDDRALTIIEEAVSVAAVDGTIETGLILLPFETYGWERELPETGVQIATFSRGSVTLRGVMGEPSGHVRRSFLAASETVANLTDSVLRLFDCTSVEEPAEQGRVELAPEVMDLFDLGSTLARLTRVVPDDDTGYAMAGTRVDLVASGNEIDVAEGLSSLELGPTTWAARVGQRLVLAGHAEADLTTPVTIVDLSEPTNPEEVATLSVPFDGFYQPAWYCPGCGIENTTAPVVLEHAVAAVASDIYWERVGTIETCSTYADWRRPPECTEGGCFHYSGWVDCESIDGGEAECYGTIEWCRTDYDGSYSWDCHEVGRNVPGLVTECWEAPREEPRSSTRLVTIDLREEAAPSALSTDLPGDLVAEVVLPTEDGLVYAVSQPVRVAGDSRDYSAWLARWVDLSDPTDPAIGAAINVPGRPLALSGGRLATIELTWTEDNGLETTVAMARVENGTVELLGERALGASSVGRAEIDSAGRLLLSQEMVGCWDGPACSPRLLVLDAESEDLAVIAEVPAPWDAQLLGLVADQPVYQLAQGVAVIDYLAAPEEVVDAFTALPDDWAPRFRLTDDAVLYVGGRHGARLIPVE